MRSGPGWVIVSPVTALPSWTLLVASLVIGLAALVRMSGPAPAAPDDIGEVIRLPEPVTGSIATLFVLAAIVLVVGLMRRLRSARTGEGEDALAPEAARIPPWLRTLNQILSLVYFLAIVYLLWRGAIPLVGLLSQGLGVGSG